GDFGNAVPEAELRRAAPLAVTDDAEVAPGDCREIVTLGLEGPPVAPAVEDPGPGEAVERHFDVERGRPFVPAIPRNVHGTDGHDRAEVVADPLAVAGRRPAGGEVVVQRVLRDVAVFQARDDRVQGGWGVGRGLEGAPRNDVPQGEERRTA